MDLSNMITLAEYAVKVGKDPAVVRQKCLRGNLPGAIKVGRDWMVPADTPYVDKRVRSGEYVGARKKAE